MGLETGRSLGLLFNNWAARIARSLVGGGKQVAQSLSSPASFDASILDASARHSLPEELLRAVIKVESNFNPQAVSHAGAKGLMQLMDGTAQALGVEDPFDPAQNIEGGARYLRNMLDHFGSLPLALAAYNAGPGAVERSGGLPPIAETQRYVQQVLALMGGAPDASGRTWEG